MLKKDVLLVSLFFCAHCIAADKPVCTSQSVTRNCEFFKEHKTEEKIQLENGTFFLNPLFKSTPAPSVNQPLAGPAGGEAYQSEFGPGATPEELKKMHDQALVDQAQALELLEDSGFSLKSKLALSSQGPMLLGAPNLTIAVPWPLSSKDGNLKEMTVSQVLAEIKNGISPQNYARLESIWKQRQSRWAASIEAQRKASAKQMEDQIAKQKLEAEQNTQKNQTRFKQIAELFEFAQAQVINAIKNGENETKLDPIKLKMLQKVREIKLNALDSPEIVNSTICAGAGNAFYNADNNKVNVCPSYFFHPDASLVAVLAHEISHSIDPCRFQMEAWDLDKSKLKEFIDQGHMNATDKETLEKINRENASTYYSSIGLLFTDSGLQDRLEKSGSIKKRWGFTEFSKYPFKKEFKCQTKENGFRAVTGNDIAQTKSFIKTQLPEHNTSPLTQRSVDRYLSQSAKYPQCFEVATHVSEMNEVMGDAFGAYTLEAYVREHPFTSEAEKVGAIKYDYSGCASSAPTWRGADYVPPSLIEKSFNRLREEHPFNSQRVANVYLARPALAAIYDCTPSGKNCFFGLAAKAKKEDEKPANDKGVR
jgi:hypothetical protein